MNKFIKLVEVYIIDIGNWDNDEYEIKEREVFIDANSIKKTYATTSKKLGDHTCISMRDYGTDTVKESVEEVLRLIDEANGNGVNL